MLALLLAFGLQGVSGETIRIGMEGPAQSFSVDEENRGMRLVIHDVNAHGGIHGRRLEEKSYPRGTDDPIGDSLANARRLVEEDDVFLLFNFGGPASVQMGDYATEARVPYLFPHTALLTVDGARYVFTSYPRYEGESRIMLRYLAQTRGKKRIAVIHDPNVYGQFFVDRARELASELGYDFAGNEPIGSRAPRSAEAEMRALREKNADAVIMALYPAQAKKVMEAKAGLEWSDVQMVSSGPLTDEQYLKVPGGYAEGTLGFCHYPDPAEAEGRGFDRYRELMKTYFPDAELNRYSLYGYVFGSLVVEGLERAGRELTRESFLDAMESIRDWDSGGILPEVSFSRDDHHAQTAGFICELENDRFRRKSDWLSP